MPNYWSGTNCRASGWAQVGEPIWRAELLVGDQLVKEWEILYPDEVMPMCFGLSSMFDSSHFASGSNVEVKFRIWTIPSGEWEVKSSPDPVVDNKSVVYGRYDMEADPVSWNSALVPPRYVFGDNTWMSANLTENRLSAMGYSTYKLEFGQGWGHAQHLADVGVPNVIYVASHGTPSRYWTDANDYTLQYAANPDGPPTFPIERITGTLTGSPNEFPILPVRQAANGTGLPPYNTGRPPINLAFIMSCSTGATNDLSTFLYPYGNWYVGTGPFPEDQAYCAFSDSLKLNQFRILAETFFDRMAQGYTVHRSRVFTMAAYSIQPPDTWLNVYGDFAMKLKGVYDGNAFAPASLAWYR